MNKRRGYYKVIAKYEDFKGYDKEDEEIFEEKELLIRGHFNNSFWIELHDHLKMEDFKDVIGYFAGGFNFKKMAEMLYFSAKAYALTTRQDCVLDSLEHATLVLSGGGDFMGEVTDAFTKCEVLSPQEANNPTQEEDKKKS